MINGAIIGRILSIRHNKAWTDTKTGELRNESYSVQLLIEKENFGQIEYSILKLSVKNPTEWTKLKNKLITVNCLIDFNEHYRTIKYKLLDNSIPQLCNADGQVLPDTKSKNTVVA